MAVPWPVETGVIDSIARPLLDSAARKLGDEARYHLIAKSEDVDPAFADILNWRAQALVVAGNATTFTARGRIADFALRSGSEGAMLRATGEESRKLWPWSRSASECE